MGDQRKAWTATEDARIRELYPTHGAAWMRAQGYLADRTREAINRRAFNLGIANQANASRRENADAPWPVPEHSYTTEDRAFRAWSAVPSSGTFVPNLGTRVQRSREWA